MPNDKSPTKPETAAQQETGGDCVSRLVRLPVSAVKMPFGSWMWFLADADGRSIAQIMPSTDEATCRELARLINLGASICEPNAGGMARELAAQDSESPTNQNG